MKLVLLVRTDLQMSAGKVGAQVAHAAVQAALAAPDDPLQRWLEQGQPKIVLAVADAEQLHHLADAAQRTGLPVQVVFDAGRTQVPARTPTVCGIGPAEDADIDAVTGMLRLF